MIEVAIKDFSKAVQIAGAALEKRNAIPILSAMKARANGRLELEATDLDMTAHVAIPCQAKDHSEFLLADASAVTSAIGAAGGASVLLEPFEKGLAVTAGPLHRITKHGMAHDDYPADQAHIASTSFSATLSPETLRQIERVASAISKEETRYYLNGISVKRLDEWTYRFAATDGHRLMLVDIPLPDAKGDLPSDVILPRRFLGAIFAHLRKADGPLAFEIGSGVERNTTESTAPTRADLSRAALAGKVGNADVRFSTKTIDGTYPDYSRVIPSGSQHQALFSVSGLRRAIQCVSAGGNERMGVALSLKFAAPGEVTVGMAMGVEGVTSDFRLECQHNVPKGFVIGFKSSYLLDILNAIRGTDVTFGIEDPSAPTTIRDVTDPAFLAVLMPMRV